MSKSIHQPPLFDAMQADADEILQYLESDDSAAEEARAWPTTLAEAIDVLAADGIERGLDEKAAIKEARRTMILLANYWGGHTVYLPRDEKLRLALRDNQIWLEFKGNNIRQLADKYKLTTTMIYIILKKQRQLTIARKQNTLFPQAGEPARKKK